MPIINIFPILTSTVDGSSPAVEDMKKQGVAKVYSTRTRVGASFSAAGSSQSKSLHAHSVTGEYIHMMCVYIR